jgi:hypothetical protein
MPVVKLDIVKNPYLILDSSYQVGTKKVLFTNSVLTDIQRIYPNATVHLSNAFLKNIMAVRRVPGLGGIPPVIEDPTKSPAQNEIAAINALWQSARIDLRIFQGYPDGIWLDKGSASLTNQLPFPMVQDDLLTYWTNALGYEFEHGCSIAFELVPQGSGLLTGSDTVSIQAGLVCKCDVVVP